MTDEEKTFHHRDHRGIAPTFILPREGGKRRGLAAKKERKNS
jgi:hypothetical protein